MPQLNKNTRMLTQRILSMFKHPMFGILTLLGNSTIAISAAIFYWLEKDSNPKLVNYLDALWWAVSTVTTVGDGNIVPISFYGKILGILMMIFGTALFCSFTALFSTVLMGYKLQEVEEELAHVDQDELALNETIQKLESTLQHLTKRQRKTK